MSFYISSVKMILLGCIWHLQEVYWNPNCMLRLILTITEVVAMETFRLIWNVSPSQKNCLALLVRTKNERHRMSGDHIDRSWRVEKSKAWSGWHPIALKKLTRCAGEHKHACNIKVVLTMYSRSTPKDQFSLFCRII